MTTKQELIEQQNKLQDELDKLKELIENTPDDEYKRPRFNYDDYWWLDATNEPHHRRDLHTKFDDVLYQNGNYYSKEQCFKIIECNQTKQQLKDLALRLNKGVEINWKDGNQFKYFIKLDYISGGLSQTQAKYSRYPSAICCLDDCFIQIARQEIGEEKLIELIKSGI